MEDPLKHMLGKQFLIAVYTEQKLQLVNYIKDGYDENKPILINNAFLHFTAHVYYRSIVVDVYALFGKPNNNNKYSLLHIPKRFKDEFKEGTIEIVSEWINGSKDFIEIIEKLRHQQIAHYDFTENNAISLNFDELYIRNELYSLAKRTISYFGASTKNKDDGLGFDFGRRHHKVDSLERLIAKASRV